MTVLLEAYLHTARSEVIGPAFKVMVMHANPSDGKFDAALRIIRSERPIAAANPWEWRDQTD